MAFQTRSAKEIKNKEKKRSRNRILDTIIKNEQSSKARKNMEGSLK